MWFKKEETTYLNLIRLGILVFFVSTILILILSKLDTKEFYVRLFLGNFVVLFLLFYYSNPNIVLKRKPMVPFWRIGIPSLCFLTSFAIYLLAEFDFKFEIIIIILLISISNFLGILLTYKCLYIFSNYRNIS